MKTGRFASIYGVGSLRKTSERNAEPHASANAGSPYCGMLDVTGPAWLRWTLALHLAMKYFIAFLIFGGVWCVGTLLVWLCTTVFTSPRHDEAILIGLPGDWRNIPAVR